MSVKVIQLRNISERVITLQTTAGKIDLAPGQVIKDVVMGESDVTDLPSEVKARIVLQD